jgi:hypothetical protein
VCKSRPNFWFIPNYLEHGMLHFGAMSGSGES